MSVHPQSPRSSRHMTRQECLQMWRTRLCERGDECRYFKRRDCKFYHEESERRCKYFARHHTCRYAEPCPYGMHTLYGLDDVAAPTAVRNRDSRGMPSGTRPSFEGQPYMAMPLPRFPLPGDLYVAADRDESLIHRAEAARTARDKLRGLGMRPVVMDRSTRELLPPALPSQPAAMRDRLHALLWVEEAQLTTDVHRYDIPNAAAFALAPPAGSGRRLYKVPCAGLAERRPSVLRGDEIHVRDNGTGRWHKGYVFYVQLDHLCVSFHDTFVPQPGRTYCVVFVVPRSTYRLQHRSIDATSVVLTPEYVKLPFTHPPFVAAPRGSVAGREAPLNAVQEGFVQRAAHGTDGVLLLHGPPGTGKTTTLVVLLQRLLCSVRRGSNVRPRVLVVTPSNLSADLIVERLAAALGGNAASHVIRPMAMSRDPKEISAVVAACAAGTTRESVLDAAAVSARPITVCTLTMAARVWGLELGKGFYDMIIVDEAAQATEAELACALQWANDNTRTVLAGDHKQLGPVVLSAAAREYGMNFSTLRRLACSAAARDAVTMLLDTYRAHPSIVRMYQRPYNNKLRVGTDVSQLSGVAPRVLPTRSHVMLCHVEGHEAQENDSPSWMNQAEAHVCVDYVGLLLQGGAKPEDIVILCPYAKQCQKLRGILHDRFTNGRLPAPYGWDGRRVLVKVATVEMYQGREARFVLLSCVRSQQVHEIEGVDRRFNIGFTRNPERANVALSRAREGLIVVGNFATLATCDVWRGVLDDALTAPPAREGAAHGVVWSHALRRLMTPQDFATLIPRAVAAAAAGAAPADADPGVDEGVPMRHD